MHAAASEGRPGGGSVTIHQSDVVNDGIF